MACSRTKVPWAHQPCDTWTLRCLLITGPSSDKQHGRGEKHEKATWHGFPFISCLLVILFKEADIVYEHISHPVISPVRMAESVHTQRAASYAHVSKLSNSSTISAVKQGSERTLMVIANYSRQHTWPRAIVRPCFVVNDCLSKPCTGCTGSTHCALRVRYD